MLSAGKNWFHDAVSHNYASFFTHACTILSWP